MFLKKTFQPLPDEKISNQCIKIVVLYHEADLECKTKLLEHLSSVAKFGMISVWEKGNILADTIYLFIREK